MNRLQVLNAFTVDESSGVIQSLGKFEREMLYVPAMWMDADPVAGSVYGVVFDEADRKEFPEIGETYGMLMEETEQGFVNATEFDTQEEYDAAVARIEREDGPDDIG